MSRLTLCIALIVAGLAVVGCGGSSDNSSSSSAPASGSKATVTPAGTAAQATVTKTKTENKSSAKKSSATEGSAAAKKIVRKQLAVVRQGRAQQKRILKQLAKAPKIDSTTTHLLKKAATGKTLSKHEMIQVQKGAQKAVKQQLSKVKIQQAKEVGKKGRSQIPARIATSCQHNLRPVDGALTSTSKAAKLPRALNATIKDLTILASTNSPAATGVTGDLAGISRGQETMMMMKRVVSPAKAYAKNPSAANRARLADTLKGLNNIAKVDQLTACGIA